MRVVNAQNVTKKKGLISAFLTILTSKNICDHKSSKWLYDDGIENCFFFPSKTKDELTIDKKYIKTMRSTPNKHKNLTKI